MRDIQGRTLLSYAAAYGDETTLSLLLDHNLDLNSEDNCGRTPLSYAVEAGNEAAVRMLFDKVGVDPNYRDKEGMSVLDYAMGAGGPNKDTVIKILIGPESYHQENSNAKRHEYTPTTRKKNLICRATTKQYAFQLCLVRLLS